LVLANPGKSLNALAAANGRCRTRLGRLVAISCLAPDIVIAIVEGKQPIGLNVRGLLDMELTADWCTQRSQLGFS